MTGLPRQCSRTACHQAAVATLTYVYADSTAVVGPLAQHAEPHCYDLCEEHALSLTVPRGWEVVHLVTDYTVHIPAAEEIGALADAITEKPVNATPHPQHTPTPTQSHGGPSLRVITNEADE